MQSSQNFPQLHLLCAAARLQCVEWRQALPREDGFSLLKIISKHCPQQLFHNIWPLEIFSVFSGQTAEKPVQNHAAVLQEKFIPNIHSPPDSKASHVFQNIQAIHGGQNCRQSLFLPQHLPAAGRALARGPEAAPGAHPARGRGAARPAPPARHGLLARPIRK